MFNPWLLLGVALSAVLLVTTPYVWRNRGSVVGLRWLAVALLPAGLAITGLFTLFGRVTSAVVHFFTRTAFSPTVWIGYALIVASVIGWVAAGALAARGRGGADRSASETRPGVRSEAGRPSATITASPSRAPAANQPAARPSGDDDDFAEVEAILRRRGI